MQSSTARRKLDGIRGQSGSNKKASGDQASSQQANNRKGSKESGKAGIKRRIEPTPKTNKGTVKSKGKFTPESNNKRVKRLLFPNAPSSGPRTRPFPSAPGSREAASRQMAPPLSTPTRFSHGYGAPQPQPPSIGMWNAGQVRLRVLSRNSNDGTMTAKRSASLSICG